MDAKQFIRQQMIAQRNALTTEMVKQKSSAIAQKVFMLPEYIEADHILLYADYRHEVMTKEIFDDAILRKKKVYFPKCNPDDSSMEFYQVVSVRQLEDGYKGIKEPIMNPEHRYYHHKEENTLVIMPGVAFDMNGHRIGYGKGYYDRYLQDKRQITAVALAFAQQLVDEIPHETYDIRMDKIVTEEIIYSFLRI